VANGRADARDAALDLSEHGVPGALALSACERSSEAAGREGGIERLATQLTTAAAMAGIAVGDAEPTTR